MKILIVEDDDKIRKILKYDLSKEGYEVDEASDGQQAITLLKNYTYDLMLLDWMLPYYSGIEILKMIDKKPITIMLSAKSEEYDMIEAFELGVDDYITKPFSPRVLMLKVKAHLKNLNKQEVYTFNEIVLNSKSREVVYHDNKIILTNKEFGLLLLLLRNKNTIVTRDDLLNDVWGYRYDGDTRVVDVYISKLRQKLPTLSFEKVYGVGYILKDE